jgi:hypothetical protein
MAALRKGLSDIQLANLRVVFASIREDRPTVNQLYFLLKSSHKDCQSMVAKEVQSLELKLASELPISISRQLVSTIKRSVFSGYIKASARMVEPFISLPSLFTSLEEVWVLILTINQSFDQVVDIDDLLDEDTIKRLGNWLNVVYAERR